MKIKIAALALVLTACGGHSDPPTKADKCNAFLDSIEQGFGQKYTPAERKDNLATCMKYGTGKAFWKH